MKQNDQKRLLHYTRDLYRFTQHLNRIPGLPADLVAAGMKVRVAVEEYGLALKDADLIDIALDDVSHLYPFNIDEKSLAHTARFNDPAQRTGEEMAIWLVENKADELPRARSTISKYVKEFYPEVKGAAHVVIVDYIVDWRAADGKATT